jgi:hypothetical protein
MLVRLKIGIVSSKSKPLIYQIQFGYQPACLSSNTDMSPLILFLHFHIWTLMELPPQMRPDGSLVAGETVTLSGDITVVPSFGIEEKS